MHNQYRLPFKNKQLMSFVLEKNLEKHDTILSTEVWPITPFKSNTNQYNKMQQKCVVHNFLAQST